MRIAFFASNTLPIHARILEERALGGTETGIVKLAEALHQLGHEVIVFTPHPTPPAVSVGPKYLPQPLVEKAPPMDAFIAVRDWIPLFYKIPAKRRFFWTGDSYDIFSNFGIGDQRVAGLMDAFLTVSDWQAGEMSQRSGFPREKCWKLGNGISAENFLGSEERMRKRLIYSSMPYRGLRHVPKFFSSLKVEHPELECHIFSSFKIYDLPNTPEFEELKATIETMDGMFLHENVLQKDLAREMMKSSILMYPCEFEETSCITAMEAMAAGTVVLSSQLGALPETVGEAGILIEGTPGTKEYDEMFFVAAHQLLKDDHLWKTYSERGLERAQSMTWKKIADRFVQFLWLLLKQEKSA